MPGEDEGDRRDILLHPDIFMLSNNVRVWLVALALTQA